MNKKLAVLLSLALLLVAFVAFASAETELTIYAPNGQGGAQAALAPNEKGVTSIDKAVNLYPSRGATVNLWYWHNETGCYNMKTGNQVNRVLYTVRGNYFNVKVISGASWLGVRSTGSFGNFEWGMASNNTAVTRTGKIRVSDRYGVICYITIQQSPAVKVVSIKQLAGPSHDGKVRIETKKATGTNGKVYYHYNYNKGQYTQIKYTSGTIWYHNNVPIGWRYYYMRPYRVLGGRLLQGPMTDLYDFYVSH